MACKHFPPKDLLPGRAREKSKKGRERSEQGSEKGWDESRSPRGRAQAYDGGERWPGRDLHVHDSNTGRGMTPERTTNGLLCS